MNDFLEFKNVSKRFGTVQAVDNVSFSVKRGEFFSLLGPSGCGKTTLLRLMAGFEQPDNGSILLDGQDITQIPPNQRAVNTVFQNYALFPHLTVRENIAFGLRVARRPRQEIDAAVTEMLKLIQMEDKADQRPNQISGGQKQRVAIVRALINRPRVLLLDEPLAALDLKLRQRMLLELDLIHDQVGITFLYVTHDQGEAMSLSDRIAVMNQGRIEQLDPPAARHLLPVQARRDDAAVVGHQEVAGAQVLQDIAELPVGKSPGRPLHDQEPRGVPWLYRGLRDQLWGKVVVEIGGSHGPSSPPGAGRSAGRMASMWTPSPARR